MYISATFQFLKRQDKRHKYKAQRGAHSGDTTALEARFTYWYPCFYFFKPAFTLLIAGTNDIIWLWSTTSKELCYLILNTMNVVFKSYLRTI